MKKTYIAPYVETDVMEAEEMMATSIVGISGDAVDLGRGDDDAVPGEADAMEDLIPLEW